MSGCLLALPLHGPSQGNGSIPVWLDGPWGIVAFVLFGLLLFWPALKGMGAISGWSLLAADYASDETPSDAERFRIPRLTMGKDGGFPITLKNVFSLRITERGLHLSQMPPFGWVSRPLLVPWRDVQAGKKEGGFRVKAVTFQLHADSEAWGALQRAMVRHRS